MSYTFTINEEQMNALIEALYCAYESEQAVFSDNEYEALKELMVAFSFQTNKQEKYVW